MLKFVIVLIIVSISSANASDLDVLIARTAIALGDEYSGLATQYQSEVSSELGKYPTSLIDRKEDVPMSVQDSYSQYTKYLNLAMDEYKIVFCETNCPAPFSVNGLSLTEVYNFLRREAFVKYNQIASGTSRYGNVGKYSTIYAVNSNFEEHLLGKMFKLVEVQQRLDSEARKISNTFTQLESSYVDLKNEVIVGVDQAILREENYTLDTQTQLSGYKSCIDSTTIEDNFEKDELVKSMSQYELLVKNLKNNYEKVFDHKFATPGGDELFTIKANQGWQNTTVGFEQGDRIFLNASGSWIVRGAVIDYRDEHLYFPLPEALAENEKQDKGWSCCKIKLKMKIKDIIAYAFSPQIMIAKYLAEKYIIPKPKALKALSDSNKAALLKIKQGLETKPDGYFFSFSSGISNGISEGTSVGAGVGWGPFSISGSKSAGSSTGTSAGTGGTYGLKLNTTAHPDSPVGALIGSFCDTAPDGINCPFFTVGNGNVLDVPDNIFGKTLWLRANEHSTHFFDNRGSLQVKIQKQTTFKTYWDQYRAWFDKECDVNGFDCGLAVILDNIAYVPDPYTVAKSAYVRQFPDFPEEVSNLILQEINSLVQLMIAGREMDSKELSRELHSTKIATCRDQLEMSEGKLENTRELISTFQRRQQNYRTKELLLDTSKRYYEDELAAINNLRQKNLERIKRYYALTISSYNYLYLDDFTVEGEAVPYFEGDYYKSQIELMEDLILEITTVNDLLNPNRGFLVYQLTDDELDGLRHPDYRQRKTQVKLDYNEFFCQGFNIENQARVMIDKVGILLDIDPAREYLFFKNSNKRNTQIQLTHSLENRFYDFSGNEKEFWMPSQKRNVAGYSTRVLVDSNSDYFQLRDSRFFERLSFRKTSFATTWMLDMTDPALLMYGASDINFSDPLLKGVKLVFWFNSVELQGENTLNQCLISPINLTASANPGGGAMVNWSFPVSDPDYSKIQQFTIYRSSSSEYGFKPVGHINQENCSLVDGQLNCSYTDAVTSENNFYYQVRSSYRANEVIGSFLDGIPSNVVSINP